MGQNQSSNDVPSYSNVTQERLIRALEEENRQKEEEIRRQNQIILKVKQEKAAETLRQQNAMRENEKKVVLKALEEESFAKKQAIIEKERVVREKERQLKEQEKIIQMQKHEIEKHKEITKNVLETVVQRTREQPTKRYNHQYNLNEKPCSSKIEAKFQNMQIASKDKSATNNVNEPKKLINEQWSYNPKSVRQEPETRQNMNNPQMFYQPPSITPYPPLLQSFDKNTTAMPGIQPFINFNVPPPNIPEFKNSSLQKSSTKDMGPSNSKENPYRKRVLHKSVSKSMTNDEKYGEAFVPENSDKTEKREKHDSNSDSDKDSISDSKNNLAKGRRRRRYGRTKVNANTNLMNSVAKGELLVANAKKTNERMLGQFKCWKCLKHWTSATTYNGVTQQCSRCLIDVAPIQLESLKKHREELCGKCKELGRNCREKPTQKSSKVPGGKESIENVSD